MIIEAKIIVNLAASTVILPVGKTKIILNQFVYVL